MKNKSITLDERRMKNDFKILILLYILYSFKVYNSSRPDNEFNLEIKLRVSELWPSGSINTTDFGFYR